VSRLVFERSQLWFWASLKRKASATLKARSVSTSPFRFATASLQPLMAGTCRNCSFSFVLHVPNFQRVSPERCAVTAAKEDRFENAWVEECRTCSPQPGAGCPSTAILPGPWWTVAFCLDLTKRAKHTLCRKGLQ